MAASTSAVAEAISWSGLRRPDPAHKFGRAPAEVDDEVGRGDLGRDEISRGAGEGQLRLDVAADHLGRHPEVGEGALDPGHEIRRIACIPRGRRRDEAHRLGAGFPAELRVPPTGREGSLHRGRADQAGRVHPVTQADDLALATDVDESAT